MKKNLLILLGIFLIIVAVISYIYYNYAKTVRIANQINLEYEEYTQQEILGSALMTVINKATDQNEKNDIEKDKNKRYIENEEKSIKIEIKFKESDKIYAMEAISELGYESFVKNYSNMSFICTKKEYHNKTNQIKYLLFEQI